jgi:hypothetical protein
MATASETGVLVEELSIEDKLTVAEFDALDRELSSKGQLTASKTSPPSG